MIDRSNGWDEIAERFISLRSATGADVVRRWARQLPRDATVVDVGCGSGIPISQTLIDAGFTLYGIDASPRLVSVFRSHFPDHHIACEAAEDSAFFHRTFDGAVAIGLVFLLPPAVQKTVLARIATALKPGGHLLMSAPDQPCEWTDSLTGRPSVSLGTDQYVRILEPLGHRLQTTDTDDGGNHYLSFVSS